MPFVLPIDEFAAPVSGEKPCGILAPVHEGQIDALVRLISPRPATLETDSDGNTRIVEPAQEPDWYRIRVLAEGLFRGGKLTDLTAVKGVSATVDCGPIRHLQVGLVLALAALRTEGIPGFADGLGLIERLLLEQWVELHPVATEDPDEPYYRRAGILGRLEQPLGQLGDPWRIAEALLGATLLNSQKQGVLSMRDCLAPWKVDLGLPDLGPGPEPTAAEIEEARTRIRSARAEDPDATSLQLAAIVEARRALAGIEGVFREKTGDKGVPNTAGLAKILESARAWLEDRVVPAPQVEPASGGRSGAGDNSLRSGPVSSRDEAMKVLVEVAAYFERHEPSSPIPMLLRRVQRLAGMSFLGILEELELGTEAVPQFRRLAGVRDETGGAAEGSG